MNAARASNTARDGTFLARVIAFPFAMLASGLGLVFTRRGLSAGLLLVVAALAATPWLRVPIGYDLRGWNLPWTGQSSAAAIALVYETRVFDLLSPGGVTITTALAGALLCLVRPRSAAGVAGLVLVVYGAALAASAMNHPLLVAELDRQDGQRAPLIAALEATAWETRVSASARAAPALLTDEPGELFRGAQYVPPHHALIPALLLVLMLLAMRGSWARRFACVGACVAIALGAGTATAWDRIRAERALSAAERSLLRAEHQSARDHVAAATRAVPQLEHLSRTWLLVGKLDLLQSAETPAAELFRAVQLYQSGAQQEALSRLAGLARREEPTPEVSRWLADSWADYANVQLESGLPEAAQAAWRRALELDPTQVFRRLLPPALEMRDERRDPARIAAAVEPIVSRVGDRVLRSSFEAMLGDLFFDCGRFAEAREYYQRSLRMFSLPKQINYRALRGLQGM